MLKPNDVEKDNQRRELQYRLKSWQPTLKNNHLSTKDMKDANLIDYELSKLVSRKFSQEIGFGKYVRDQNVEMVKQIIEILNDLNRINIPWAEKIDQAKKENGFKIIDRIIANDWECNPFAERLIGIDVDTLPEMHTRDYQDSLTRTAKKAGDEFAKHVLAGNIKKAEESYNEIMRKEIIWAYQGPAIDNPLEKYLQVK